MAKEEIMFPIVRQMCPSFPFSQELLETGISSSPICLVFRPLKNFRTTSDNFLLLFSLLLHVIFTFVLCQVFSVIFSPQGILLSTSKLLELDKVD